MSAMKRVLRVRDGLAITVGIVIGAGILRTPGLIAEYLGNGWLSGRRPDPGPSASQD